MRLRPFLLPALAVGLVAATPALSAPKSCNLVVDPSGDGRSDTLGVSSDRLDVLGADVASYKKEVVGIIRLKSTDVSSDPYAALEYRWILSFQIQGQDFTLQFERSGGPFGRDRASADIADQPAEVKTEVTPTSITWRVPRKAFAVLVKKPGKLYFDNIAASSNLMRGSADMAIGGKNKYLDMSPSCLAAS